MEVGVLHPSTTPRMPFLPVPHPGNTYFIKPTGDNSANGLSDGTAWADFDNVLNLVSGAHIYLKSGETFTDPLVINDSGIVVGIYGGSDPVAIDLSRDVLGVAGDWAEYATNGTTLSPGTKRWRRIVAGDGAHRLFLIVEGLMPVTPDGFPTWSQNTASLVNSAGKWRFQYNTSANNYYLFVYSETNPATAFGSLRTTTELFAIDALGRQVRIEGPIVVKGGQYGVVCGGGLQAAPTIITDVTMQFASKANFWMSNGGYAVLTRCTIADCGYSPDGADGKGDECCDWTAGSIGRNGAFIVKPYPFELVNCDMVNCLVYNAKEDLGTMRFSDPASRVRIIGTDPQNYSSRWEATLKSENCYDSKSGNITIQGTYMHAHAGAGAVTVQIGSRECRASSSIINTTGRNSSTMSLAETDTYLVSDHTGYYSEGSSVIQQRYTGKASTSEFDIAISDYAAATVVGVVAAQQGRFSLKYTSLITSRLADGSRALYYQNSASAANVSAIELKPGVTQPSGGFYTYRFVCTGTFQNFFGADSQWTVTGLTGASAALNAVQTITETYPYSDSTVPHYADFLVAEGLAPPATVSITGLNLAALPIAPAIDACALYSTKSGLFAPVPATLEAASYGSNFVACVSALEAVVARSSRTYTETQVKTDAVAVNNLKTDTGNRWGGTSTKDGLIWRTNYSAVAGTKFWAEKEVASLTVGANGIVTVVLTGAHGWTGKRRVCIRAGSPTYVNGWRWVTVTDTDKFTYPAPKYPRLAVDVVATGTDGAKIWVTDGMPAVGSAALAGAPVVASDYTTDFHGVTLPGSGRNDGAVQPAA